MCRLTSVFAVLGLAVTVLPPVAADAAERRDPFKDYTTEYWSARHGLGSSRIFAITQDQVGYLWLGTEGGLVRFDGVRFVRWLALPEATVTALCNGRDGSLWVGFGNANGGISRIRNGKIDHYGEPQGILSSATVVFLLEDRTGTIWAGKRDGLYRFQRNRWERMHEEHGLPDARPYAGYEDNHGNLWFGTSVGVIRRLKDEDRFEFVDPARNIQMFTEDASGAVWRADSVDGFALVGSKQSAPKSFHGNGVRVLYDRRGDLWVGTGTEGLWKVRRHPSPQAASIERITIRDGLSSDTVRSLFEDREGNVWVGTEAGLHRFTPSAVTSITNVGSRPIVSASSDGGAWVGSTTGLTQFDAERRRQHGQQLGVRGPETTAMYTDRSGTLWVATPGGVVRRVAGRWVPVVLGGTARRWGIGSLATDSRGTLWLCDQDDGIFYWTAGKLTAFVPPPEVTDSKANFVYVDRRDRVWMSFAGGGLLVLRPDGQHDLYTHKDGLGRYVMAIYEDQHDAVWVGGTHGLSRFRGGRLETITRQDGLPGFGIFGIVEDADENLWLGVSSGIVRLSRPEFEVAAAAHSAQLKYELLDTSDGLAGVPLWFGGLPTATQTTDGKLWFVTGGGITVVDPRDFRRSATSIPARIERVTADDQPVDFTQGAVLPAGMSKLLIEYTAINLTSPTKLHFRHRLEGVDANWVADESGRSAVYAKLPPGHYTFRAVATDIAGAWNESTAELQVSISPTFYQTRWFVALCTVSVALAMWLVWRIRLRQVRREFSSVLAERSRMSREIHDTLLQGMVGMTLQLDVLSHSLGASAGEAAQRLTRMRRQLEEYIRETRQSIFDLRSQTLQRRELSAALRETAERLLGDSAARFELIVSGDPSRCSQKVEEQLARIGREALVNAVRHADASRIQLTLQYHHNAIVLCVADDGRGFDLKNAPHATDGHVGLLSMQERAEQVGGYVRVNTSIGAGTEVQAVVPIASHS
jgi:signal transduction histidine kinase/ligand-binding sensor domain-containing protein